MDASKGKGTGTRRLGASSYLLELVPDVQQPNEGFRHRMHIENISTQFQLSGRPEDSMHRHHHHEQYAAASQSMHWGGRDQIRDELIQRFPNSSLNKPRFARSKKRSLQGPDLPTPTEPTPPKDHVIFSESPTAPGVPVVYRSQEERIADPDRLNLDRRHLTVCPIFEGEERLRLLNLQHNSITRLQHLNNLRRLVFLDLYDNMVHEIMGLEGLLSLRVLMLGRNRIRKITGLQNLVKLDVLDLHGNMIQEIEYLNHLSHLRVLNLAGNNITCVSGLAGLQALAELNLRRNRITHVYELDELANLQRLYLSHNLIQSFDDAPCLSHCDNLTELTLDGNPLANAPDHRQSVIYHVNQLHILDQTPVSEEERHEALAAAREEEEHMKEQKKIALMEKQKEATIRAIRAQWEESHQLRSPSLVSSSSPSIVTSSKFGRHDYQGSLSCTSLPKILPPSFPTYFLHYEDFTLHLYGWGALEALETSAPLHKKTIRELHFHCIEFEDIARLLPKLMLPCPSVTSLGFDCTNMSGLEQVNALAQLTTPLNSLTVSSHGNPITSHLLFSAYTLYRLSHLNLSVLDGEPVKDKELVEAEQIFGKLGQLTTSRLPKARLLALISQYRPRNLVTRKLIPSSTAVKSITCSEPVNRYGLHHYSPNSKPLGVAQQDRVSTAGAFCTDLLTSTLTTHKKLESLEELWPKVMAKLVHGAVMELSTMDHHMKSTLDQL